MSLARRQMLALVSVALVSVIAYGAGWAIRPATSQDAATAPTSTGESTDRPSEPAQSQPAPDTTPTLTPEPGPLDAPAPGSELEAGSALLAPGERSDDVSDLQARLRQIGWFAADVTGFYGEVTAEAVRGFQARREIPVTGEVDRRTLDLLFAMTSEPTDAELTNQIADGVPGALDPR